jgi:CRISPR/Cas system CSM-associated protein Csm2 small subunit
MHNKPEGGYDQATLTTYFNEIVETRGLTQKSMNMVLAAKDANSIESLKDLEFVTILLDRFNETLSYTKHSNKPFSEKVAELQPIVDKYNSLDSDQQEAALTELLDKVVNRSQDTIDEFAAILDAIVAEEEAIEAALEAINEMTGVISGIVDRDIAALHGEDEEELDELDITFLEDVIKEAIAAKEGIVISEDGSNVPVGTYWVTQEDMDALNAAIDAAEAAKGTVEIQQDVAEAAKALEAAVSTFNDAKQEAIDDEKELEETESPVNEQESDTENDEATTEETVEEVSGEEITEESAIETDESQLEGDAEVIEEAGEEEAA